jgi:hypothetical protein
MWDRCFFLWDPKICGIHKYLYKAKPGAAQRSPAGSHNLTIARELFLVQALFIEIKAHTAGKVLSCCDVMFFVMCSVMCFVMCSVMCFVMCTS